MVSHGDNGDYEFEDWASVHGHLLPWSDDQTTATYQVAQLSHLQHFARANTGPHASEPALAQELQELSWLDTSATWDPALVILEASDAPPAPAAFVPTPLAPSHRYASSPVPSWQPASELEPPRSMPPAQPLTYPSFEPSAPEDEENPFAAPNHALRAWTLAVLAAAGLFAGVLFGRVLLRTSMSADLPFAPITPAREAAPLRSLEPAAPAAAAAPDVTDARPSVQPPSAAEPAGARKPAAKRSWHARSAHDADESSSEPLERTPSESAAAALPHESARGSASAEREAPAQASDESAAPGSLRINSRPWSQVFVDGRLVGNTPQLGVSVPAGRHTIRLFNPEFGMSKTFAVSVAPGESVTRIEMLED